MLNDKIGLKLMNKVLSSHSAKGGDAKLRSFVSPPLPLENRLLREIKVECGGIAL